MEIITQYCFYFLKQPMFKGTLTPLIEYILYYINLLLKNLST